MITTRLVRAFLWHSLGPATCACIVPLIVVAVALAIPFPWKDNQGKITNAFVPVFTTQKPLTVAYTSSRNLSTTDFQLQHKATSGWYIIDVNLQFKLNPSTSTDARNYVSVLVNGAAIAQIEFQTVDVDGLRQVRWSTLELFNGGTYGLVSDTKLSLHFMNYMGLADIKQGSNALSLELAGFKGTVVRLAHLLPGSHVSYGTLGPPHLGIGLAVAPPRVRVGSTFMLRYEIASRGIPAHDVDVSISSPSSGILAKVPLKRHMERVSKKGGAVWFRALKPGMYKLTVVATGKTGGSVTNTVIVEVLTSN